MGRRYIGCRGKSPPPAGATKPQKNLLPISHELAPRGEPLRHPPRVRPRASPSWLPGKKAPHRPELHAANAGEKAPHRPELHAANAGEKTPHRPELHVAGEKAPPRPVVPERPPQGAATSQPLVVSTCQGKSPPHGRSYTLPGKTTPPRPGLHNTEKILMPGSGGRVSEESSGSAFLKPHLHHYRKPNTYCRDYRLRLIRRPRKIVFPKGKTYIS